MPLQYWAAVSKRKISLLDETVFLENTNASQISVMEKGQSKITELQALSAVLDL